MKIIIIILFIIHLIFSYQLRQENINTPFKNKVALVTGGSTGIGYATALQFAQKGGYVVFCARNKHPQWYNGEDAEKKINNDPLVKQSGGSAIFFKADITEKEQVKQFIEFIHKKYGRIDYAINNAGIGGKTGRIDQFDEDWFMTKQDAVYNNLYGGLYLVHEQTKYWMKYGNPNETYSIVMLSSYNGIRGCESCDSYSASKHGIIGIVQSVAQSFATTKPRIRINAVAPGLTNTFLTRNQVKPNPDEGEAITEDNPLWIQNKDKYASQLVSKRLAEPYEIANAILFLSSNEASYISGIVLPVDAGDSSK